MREDVGRTKLLRKLQPWLVHVDGDDGGGIRHLGGHDRGKTDRANAEDSDSGADRYLHRCQYRPGAGLQAAAERS